MLILMKFTFYKASLQKKLNFFINCFDSCAEVFMMHEKPTHCRFFKIKVFENLIVADEFEHEKIYYPKIAANKKFEHQHLMVIRHGL